MKHLLAALIILSLLASEAYAAPLNVCHRGNAIVAANPCPKGYKKLTISNIIAIPLATNNCTLRTGQLSSPNGGETQGQVACLNDEIFMSHGLQLTSGIVSSAVGTIATLQSDSTKAGGVIYTILGNGSSSYTVTMQAWCCLSN